MRTFYLYGFSDGRITIITRGENEDQAMDYASRNDGPFPKGVTIYPLNHLPINAAALYDVNHDPDWLHRSPVWLRKKEQQEAIKKGSASIISDIQTMLQNRRSA